MNGIEPQWAWLSVAALLAIAELVVPGVFLIWFAIAAAATGLVTLVTGVALPFQIALFALFAIAALYGGRRAYASAPVPTSDPLLNDRAARLKGRMVTVVGAIEHGEGRVRVGDSVWNARGPDCEPGARVRITGVEGTCLLVEQDEKPLPAPERP
ncbi:MAG: NfeD family protein [Allosphingosinicella sp.]